MYSKTSELFELNKMFLIYAVSLGVFYLLTLKYIMQGEKIIKKTPFNWQLLLFLGATVASTLLSIDMHTSLFGYYGRFNGGLISIIAYITLYFGFISEFRSRKDVEKILLVSLISSFLVILWGLPGRFGADLSCLVFTGQFDTACWSDQFQPEQRMFSTLGQPNWLGAYLAIHFFIGLYFYLRTNLSHKMNLVGSWFFGMYSVLNFTAILFTRSRSALLAIGFSLICLSLYLTIRQAHFKKMGLVTIGIVLSILIFKTGYVPFDTFISFEKKGTEVTHPTQTSSSDITESGDIRKIVWKGAIELGKRYPLLGTGPETFAYSYYQTRPVEHNLVSEWDFIYNKAHNEYLNYFATAGFIGLGTYLILMGFVIFNFLQPFLAGFNEFSSVKYQNEQLLLLCLFCSYITILITNFFGFSTSTINLFFFLIPAFLTVITDKKKLETSKDLSRRMNPVLKVLLILFVSSFTFYALLFLSNYYRADMLYAEAQSYENQEDYSNASLILHRALKLHEEHVYQDKLSNILANVSLIASYQGKDNTSKELMSASELFNTLSRQASPKNPLYWKTKAKNYFVYYQITNSKKDIETAIEAIKEAQKLSPTDPRVFYTSAVLYSQLADSEENEAKKKSDEERAVKEITTSIKLKPNFRDGYFLRGQLLKKYQDKEQAAKDFRFLLKMLPTDEEAQDELKKIEETSE